MKGNINVLNPEIPSDNPDGSGLVSLPDKRYGPMIGS